MSKVRVAIACQGGGNYTAFTAGVLAGILQEVERRKKSGTYYEDRFEIVGLSGTAGGAICALLAWYGLINDEGIHPVSLLKDFWLANEESLKVINSVYFSQLEPLFNSHRGYSYQDWLNLMDDWQNWQIALKVLLEKVVNFERLSKMPDRAKIMLQVGALNTGTSVSQAYSNWATEEYPRPASDGETITTCHLSRERPAYRPGIYNTSKKTGITHQALLASSSVPFIFPLAEYGQDYIYDGLFSQNPPLKDLPDCSPDEIWLIRTHSAPGLCAPVVVRNSLVPSNRLDNNFSLALEIRFMIKIQELLAQGALRGKYQPINLLEIPSSIPLEESECTSKQHYTQPFINLLLERGEKAARYFFDRSRTVQLASWERKRQEWAETGF